MSIKIENTVLPSPEQWEAIIRGMRNPKNSWDRSDTIYNAIRYLNYCDDDAEAFVDEDGNFYARDVVEFGENDLKLMRTLAEGGPVHAKYRRMTPVFVDITAPLYWWKEFDTYKVGTVANSCSTMHKIQAKEFTLEDFSHEHLFDDYSLEYELTYSTYNHDYEITPFTSLAGLQVIVDILNHHRMMFLETKDKKYWWQMIQLLPSSYNQKRTIFLNYEVLVGIYRWRKNHKLDEWRVLCDWIKTLPESELITGECDEEKIYSFDFFGHHGEVYVPANATETEINAAIFEEMSKMVEITKKYECTVDKK